MAFSDTINCEPTDKAVMAEKVFNVLFLCTGNSARSILAEALLNHAGRDRFRGFSAGSQPTGEVHPLALEQLRRARVPTDGLRSKHWSEFAKPGAPSFDFVLAVCDNAANEVCPIWPGHPINAHWGIPDPAAVTGSSADKAHAFDRAWQQLAARIALLVSLRPERLEPLTLKRKLQDIGRSAQ